VGEGGVGPSGTTIPTGEFELRERLCLKDTIFREEQAPPLRETVDLKNYVFRGSSFAYFFGRSKPLPYGKMINFVKDYGLIGKSSFCILFLRKKKYVILRPSCAKR